MSLGATTTMENPDHHVRFDAGTIKSHDAAENCVTYQRQNDTISISLGFLQINHRYMIDLELPTSLFDEYTDITQFIPEVTTVPNLHCRITDFSVQKDFCNMKIAFFAYKEKLLRETVTIVNSKNDKEIFKLILAARVLGQGMGTPMLRGGIHFIGVGEEGSNVVTKAPASPNIKKET